MGEPLPAWTRDPARLEMIFHEALRQHDVEGVGYVLTLLAVCDPPRAAALRNLLEIALVLKDTEPVADAP